MNVSEARKESHTPVSPRTPDSMKAKKVMAKIPLDSESTDDSLPIPAALKKPAVIMLTDAGKKPRKYSFKPDTEYLNMLSELSLLKISVITSA